ncbi:MAG: hypothetical protein JWN73_1649 [Betaproteobacteria bacterium]|nr:hypothetical protein [Betaproteobacteria bacterium]
MNPLPAEAAAAGFSIPPGAPAGAPDEDACRLVLQRLSFLFRRNAADVTSQALFRALYEYRTGTRS